MSKQFKRVLAWLTVFCLVVGTMHGVITADAAALKLSTKKATVAVGDKTTLKVANATKDATIAWSTSDKKVVKVTKNGVVTGVKAGKAVVTAAVTQGKTTKTLTCNVTVKSAIVVATKAQLKKALKNENVTKITIKTDAARSFKIAAGNYGNKTLVVNAANSDVINKGIFANITIKAIKSNTWTERAKGNSIKVTASTANIIVGPKGNVASIDLAKANANISLKVNGAVNQVVASKKADVKLTANGTIGLVTLKAPTVLAISGKAEKVNLVVEANAKGSNVETSVPVDAKVGANIALKLQPGAEGSTLDKTSKDVVLIVSNQTSEAITVTTGGTDAVIVNSGSKETVGGTDTTSPTSPTSPTNPTSPTSPTTAPVSTSDFDTITVTITTSGAITAISIGNDIITTAGAISTATTTGGAISVETTTEGAISALGVTKEGLVKAYGTGLVNLVEATITNIKVGGADFKSGTGTYDITFTAVISGTSYNITLTGKFIIQRP